MSDVSDLPHQLSRPLPPRTWHDRLGDLTAGDLSLGRLVAGLCALAVAAVVGWRLIAPPAPPPEMELPFAEQAAPTAEAGVPGAAPTAGPAGSASPGASGTSGATAAGGAPGVAGGTSGATTGTDVVVHVVGAVARPGVQRLPAGARIVDAVDAAGGAAPDADLGRINLAAVLADGQQVYVLRVGETPPVPATVGGTGLGALDVGGGAGTAGAGGPGALVDVNRASADQLDELPGVGPTTAEAIITHREQNGPFATVDDLLDVRGIGEAKLEQLRGLVTV
jgi:competence protein ComEA